MKKAPPLATIDAAGACIIIAGALATYFLGVQPAQRAQAQDRADRETLTQRTGELEAAQQQLKTFRASLENLQQQVGQTDNVLHPSSELFARVQAITLLAQDHSLVVSEMTPAAAISGKRFTRVPIHITGVGSYPDFTAFISTLHSMYTDLQVVSFRITGKPDDNHVPKPSPHFDADLNWYTALESKDAVSAAGKVSAADAGLSGSAAAPSPPGRQNP